jgi:hypothetical protein
MTLDQETLDVSGNGDYTTPSVSGSDRGTYYCVASFSADYEPSGFGASTRESLLVVQLE